MKNAMVFMLILILLGTSLNGFSHEIGVFTHAPLDASDVDPTVDLSINVEIKRVRTINITIGEPPSFVVKVMVNGEEWKSNVVTGFDVMNVGTATFDVPDDKKEVEIKIEVTKNGVHGDIGNESNDVIVIYDLLNGTWHGDDWRGDKNGYGHTSGTEDGKYGEDDCEIWFDITENDFDGDGIPYWVETNVYHTDPEKDNRGEDMDGDGVPIEWEWKWGYNPFSYEEHSKLDVDKDGLQNDEEYMMADWFADPFRQDIYIENDYMAEHNGIKPIMPEEAIQMQYSAFTKHNIMLLIDTGQMGGSEEIPYESLHWDNLHELYEKYFLHGNENNPRKGVFHYALIIHTFRDFGRGVGGFNFRRDAFAVCSAYIQRWRPWEEGMIIGHGGSYMHELGHQLGLPHLKVFPWQLLYWLSGHYKSCMNYRYNFKIVDYSDGSHGFMDRDEWSAIDPQRFER